MSLPAGAVEAAALAGAAGAALAGAGALSCAIAGVASATSAASARVSECLVIGVTSFAVGKKILPASAPGSRGRESDSVAGPRAREAHAGGGRAGKGRKRRLTRP